MAGGGLHIEGQSTVFASGTVTACNYVVLRILGMNLDHPAMPRAHGTLNKLRGALGIPLPGEGHVGVNGVLRMGGDYYDSARTLVTPLFGSLPPLALASS